MDKQASARLRRPMLSSSENLRIFMPVILLVVDGLLLLKTGTANCSQATQPMQNLHGGMQITMLNNNLV